MVAVHRPVAAHVVAIAVCVVALAGCNLNLNFGGSGDDEPDISAVSAVSHGACWPTYDTRVQALAMNRSGQVVYIANSKPAGWPDDRAWSSADRALNVLDVGSERTRYIGRTWAAQDFWPTFATARPGTAEPSRGQALNETLRAVDIGANTDRFVVGVSYLAENQIAKLYHGRIPASGNAELAPGDGLTVVPVNDPTTGDRVRTFAVSPDGSKLAAIVGAAGELRVYDFDAEQLSVYIAGSGGTEVASQAPARGQYEPAIATPGTVFIAWSPDSTRLSLARRASGGTASIVLASVADGALAHVTTYASSSAPHVAWAEDGQSLYVLVTTIDAGGNFGDTQISRLAAEQNGAELDSGTIPRQRHFRTEPAHLVNIGNDSQFAFVWESALWRLDVPDGRTSETRFQRVTPISDYRVSGRPAASESLDKAVFLITDSSGTHVGARTAFSQEDCPAPTVSGQGGAR